MVILVFNIDSSQRQEVKLINKKGMNNGSNKYPPLMSECYYLIYVG